MTEPRTVPIDDVIDLRVLFSAWWRGKWLFLIIGVAAAGIGFWQMMVTSPVYRAEILVLPENNTTNVPAGGASGRPG